MRRLTLATGKTLDVALCGQSGSILAIKLTEPCSLLEALDVFGKAENTAKMNCDFGSNIYSSYVGYTLPIYATLDADTGQVTVGLKKEAKNE